MAGSTTFENPLTKKKVGFTPAPATQEVAIASTVNPLAARGTAGLLNGAARREFDARPVDGAQV